MIMATLLVMFVINLALVIELVVGDVSPYAILLVVAIDIVFVALKRDELIELIQGDKEG